MTRRGTSGDARRLATGQALVEFALVATVMALLLGGLAQFGMIFERQIGINNAVREAARRGATQATPDSATALSNATWTYNQLQSLLTNSQDYSASAASNLRACYSTSSTLDPAGNYQVEVTVTAGYHHPLFLPIITQILDGLDGTTDNALYLSTSSTFAVEQTTSVNLGSASCYP